MIKTGKLFLGLLIFCVSTLNAVPTYAAIQASVDRSEIPQDESISFKVTLVGNPNGTIHPKFDAPDFEIMNQFENSQYSSVYINGKFENKSEHSITYILRPNKTGTLRIRNISNDGEKAPDVSVQVVQENAYKRTVPGSAPSLQGDNKNFFLKAEVSKSRAYKGEQVIVSFYLYRRTRVNLRDVMQYPNFEGFIREDLEMPILSGRPDFEAVNLGGVPFERALLARYAVYPIKEGKLKIDGFSVRADYIPKNSANDDAFEDPFFQFFSQVTPRTGTAKSDPITIDVLPLPEEAAPNQFTGGVGDFEVSSQVDSSGAKANSPLTLHVDVKGKGNTSLIEFPQVNWPKNIKFYETQGKTKNLGQGQSEKTFDVVIVPLEKGTAEIPPIEFEFFNPESRSYVKKKTVPITLQVAEGDPNSAPMVDTKADTAIASKPGEATPTNGSFGALRLKDPKVENSGFFLGQPWWRWVAWFGLLVFFCFVGMVIFDSAKKRSKTQIDLLRRRQNMESYWNKIDEEAAQKSQNFNVSVLELSKILENAVDQLYKTLDDAFSISSRALPQRDLAKVLTENAFDPKPVMKILDFSEMVRFASGSGIVDDSQVRNRLPEAVHEIRELVAQITSKKVG
jgi:hypothetical protein